MRSIGIKHYSAVIQGGKRKINYNGNKIYPAIDDIGLKKFEKKLLKSRLDAIVKEKRFYHLHRIDNAIFFSTVNFFKNLGAEWCNLPLTTLMISSPGEIYAGKTIDYTTDALPIDINWFGNKRHIFLSESSQFYLELRLLIDKVDKVFSIYNSFRKEKADFSHLSEFQHIEFEGKVGFDENVSVFLSLLKHITRYIVAHNKEDLLYFLNEKEVDELSRSFEKEKIHTITFRNALQLLLQSTQNGIYKKFSLEHFGAWEEIKLTELLGGHVLIKEFPLLQIPFYHNTKKEGAAKISVAENADLILYGYREAVGSGTRISNLELLAAKARFFHLPPSDYEPYLQIRKYAHYRKTSGFGLGWQRYVHWLLKLPYIWEATHVPRGHLLPIL